jgi:hypothetical protein
MYKFDAASFRLSSKGFASYLPLSIHRWAYSCGSHNMDKRYLGAIKIFPGPMKQQDKVTKDAVRRRDLSRFVS